MMGELLEKWKNGIVIPIHKKGEKQRVEICRGISLLNSCYKLYSKILNEELQVRAEEFLWYAKMVCEKASVHC